MPRRRSRSCSNTSAPVVLSGTATPGTPRARMVLRAHDGVLRRRRVFDGCEPRLLSKAVQDVERTAVDAVNDERPSTEDCCGVSTRTNCRMSPSAGRIGDGRALPAKASSSYDVCKEYSHGDTYRVASKRAGVSAVATSEARFRHTSEAHHRAVLAYFLRRMDRDCAYEATEDVFLVAWRRLDDAPDGERALAWLYAVARRVLSNHRRSVARRRRLSTKLAHEPPSRSEAPEPIVIRKEEYKEVLDALHRLSQKDQEVLRLAVWEELPHAEIAQLMGCSVGAVAVRIHRATRRLGKGIEGAGHRDSRRPAFQLGEEQ